MLVRTRRWLVGTSRHQPTIKDHQESLHSITQNQKSKIKHCLTTNSIQNIVFNIRTMFRTFTTSLKSVFSPSLSQHSNTPSSESSTHPQTCCTLTRLQNRIPKNRLEVIYGNAIHIHGFPATHPFGASIASVFLYLCPLPAEVDYIMGANWREKLISAPAPMNSSSPGDGKDLKYIPRPNPSSSPGVDGEEKDEREQEEKEHCLRIMRCGAGRVQIPGSALSHVPDPWNLER
ncbi:hypothetical protein DL98DRAFT_175142 [Cadophora sp. DSE1049]|nr:hypothetical protein DL98DRAFT_175142 [Cadophora sp. DSE1049]